MSGGSFNYFYSNGHERARDISSTLEAMARAAARAGAPHAESRLMILSAAAEILAEELRAHEDLLQTIEWYKSCDYGPESVRELEGKLPPLQAGGIAHRLARLVAAALDEVIQQATGARRAIDQLTKAVECADGEPTEPSP